MYQSNPPCRFYFPGFRQHTGNRLCCVNIPSEYKKRIVNMKPLRQNLLFHWHREVKFGGVIDSAESSSAVSIFVKHLK